MSTSRSLPSARSFLSKVIPYNFSRLPSPPPSTTLAGRTAIITGANSGLGLECARQFLHLGLSHLILAVRAPSRGQEAAASLAPINPSATISVWELDLMSYDSIHAFTQRCDAELKNIDIVVLNAGGAFMDHDINPSTRHERTFALNHYGPALLSLLLLPILRSHSHSHYSSTSTPPRITYIGSIGGSRHSPPHQSTTPFLKAFDDPKQVLWSPAVQYAYAKLMPAIFFVALAERVRKEDVTVNVVELGLTRGTAATESLRGVVRFVFGVAMAMLARDVGDSVKTYVDAAVVRGVESHGSMLGACQVVPYPTYMYGESGKMLSDKVFKETMDEFTKYDVYDILKEMDRAPQ